ncbi:ribokinase [Paenibacillus mucilaginosus KNP414]|uniref:Ribokinase n=2 Tax=Paenibacillus mucilaginosus TaxID=61624 RepID=F8FQA9_PAEMK|nr:ribokinase [Paenibacillus mucilaginosus KNP414]
MEVRTKHDMKPKIAVVGSLNMDIVVSMARMPLVGETVQGSAVHYIPGGKGANQAAGAARLGAEVKMIGSVGSDIFGTQLVDSLRAFGVDTEAIDMLPGVETGTATILHTREDNCIVVVPGANAHCSADAVRHHHALIEQADLLLVQLEVPLDTVREALSIARSAGVRTILNPAPAVPLPADILSLADILTPNETELALLSNQPVAETDQALMEQLAYWRELHEGRVVVTRGAIGSSYLEAGVLQTVKPLKVKVADTTGAGDAFNGALGYCIAAGLPFRTAVDFACRTASLSVTKFGAQGGLPTWSEVDSTYA